MHIRYKKKFPRKRKYRKPNKENRTSYQAHIPLHSMAGCLHVLPAISFKPSLHLLAGPLCFGVFWSCSHQGNNLPLPECQTPSSAAYRSCLSLVCKGGGGGASVECDGSSCHGSSCHLQKRKQGVLYQLLTVIDASCVLSVCRAFW